MKPYGTIGRNYNTKYWGEQVCGCWRCEITSIKRKYKRWQKRRARQTGKKEANTLE